MRNIDVMGIINLTDNSYFSESRCLGEDGRDDIGKIVARAVRMAEEGATILDIGACSTRPGSEAVGEDEEWLRLEPALKAIRRELPDIRISVDTYWPSVVRKTYGLIGDFIVNDVTAGEGMEGDSSYRKGEMLPLVGRRRLDSRPRFRFREDGGAELPASVGAWKIMFPGAENTGRRIPQEHGLQEVRHHSGRSPAGYPGPALQGSVLRS